MKRMNSDKKRIPVASLALLLILTMVLSTITPIYLAIAEAAPSGDDFTIEANLGFSGNVKTGTMAHMKVTLANNSSDYFDGKIKIICFASSANYGSKQYYNSYIKEVEIPASGETALELDTFMLSITQKIEIVLLDKRGREIKTFQPKQITDSNSVPWVGVLSDAAEDLINPRHLSIAHRCKIIKQEELGELSETLGSLDAILINDYNTKQLSNRQLVNLKKWIQDGGTLILGLGKDSTKVRGGLVDILDEDVAVPFVGETLYSSSNDGQNTIINSSPVYFHTANDINLGTGVNISEQHLGYGVIYINEFDLLTDIEAMSSEKFKNEMFEINNELNIMLNQNNGYTIVNAGDKFYAMKEANKYSFIEDGNMQAISIGIIVIYGIIIGPILFIILKKKDRREKAVKIIPCMAIAITIIIYLFSLNSAYKKPIANVLSIIDMDANPDINKKVAVGLKIMTRNSGTEMVTAKGNFETIMVDDDQKFDSYASDNYTATNKIDYSNIYLEEGLKVELLDTTRWQGTNMSLYKEVDNIGDINMSLNVDEKNINLTVTNNTGCDLEDCVITRFAKCYKLGDIKNGETKDFTFAKNIDQVTIDELYGINNDYYYYSRYNDEESSNIDRQRSEILRKIAASAKQNDYTFVGFNTDDILNNDFKVNRKSAKQYNSNVFVSSKFENFSDYTFKVAPKDNFQVKLLQSNAAYIGYYSQSSPEYQAGEVAYLNTAGEAYLRLAVSDFTNLDFEYMTIEWDMDEYGLYLSNNKYGTTEISMSGEKILNDSNYINESGELILEVSGLSQEIVSLPKVTVYFN